VKPLTRRAILLSSLLVACGPKGDPARQALDAVVKGAEGRDADDVLKRIAADYKDDEGSGRVEVEGLLKRYLAAYDSLSIRLSDVTIEPGASARRATFVAHLSGTPRKLGGLEGFLPRSAAYRFEVRLAPENGVWKIYKASWRQLE